MHFDQLTKKYDYLQFRYLSMNLSINDNAKSKNNDIIKTDNKNDN